MSILLRATFCLAGIILIFMVVKSLVNRHISEEQSLFWVIIGVGVMIVGAFPSLSVFIASIFGVEYIPSIIFSIGIVMALYGIFNCFQSIASLNNRVQELAMQVSLINQQNEMLFNSYKPMDAQPSEAKTNPDEEYITI